MPPPNQAGNPKLKDQQKQVRSKLAVAATSPINFLDERQLRFCDAVARGTAPNIAARMAGYSQGESQGYQILQRPKIQEAIRYLHKKYEKVSDMTRKKVMDGILEAIDMAKMQADAGNMISGWREIGRMCGYYAPEVKKIDINISAKRVIDKLETLSDEELVQMIEDSSQIIEAEATEVLDAIQAEDDANSPLGE